MTIKEEAQKFYEDKYFYEIVKIKSGRKAGTIQLFGPYDNIYYVERPLGEKTDRVYKYIQVINGLPVQAFTEEEILVTDRKL
jgi:hypothetical protein